ncbi:hypothetical protein [Actinomadura opuntiae]|uniref:hypothetical protein n=1 Tax=Actinomadura sp. OS1-43 TaxID=604315 RepID=UPI00255B0C35|nr:hypothetical protein [Actinomadura sp. OS1-43]MDL4820885.1 hypothetical protein [Actinomadura sp. OS1-43]
MITLKAALIAAGAIGTVAVGGGATWAMTGSHQDAGLRADAAKLPGAHRVVDAAPKSAPTCLPASALPKTGKAAKNGGLPKTGELPKPGDLPTSGLPTTAKLPGTEKLRKEAETAGKKAEAAKPDVQVPNPGVPGVVAPGAKPSTLPSAPANLPACAPSAKPLPKGGAPAAKPSARVPAKPAQPALPALDCRKLVPAVKVGGPVEKTVMLAKGLKYTATTPGGAELAKLDICAVTQKWTGKAGQWLTVERLKTPAGMTQNQLRQALQLPEGGTPLTVDGFAAYQGPHGGGVLVFDPSGYSLFVNGSPVLAGGPKDVATALRQAHQ